MTPTDPRALATWTTSAADRRLAAANVPSAHGAVVEYIVEHHHVHVRRALPYVVALLAKAAAFHGGRNRKLGALCDAGRELAECLEGRLDAAERALYPALLAPGPARDAAVQQLHRDHGELRLHLARVRWLADDFASPGWAGRSYQVLMEELEALEEDLLEQLHLESFVLAPGLAA